MELKNRTALVTGGGSGIGRAVALALAGAGAFVIVAGRNVGRLAKVVAQIKDAGGDARGILADIGDLDSLRRLVEESGQVDILVNNAASTLSCRPWSSEWTTSSRCSTRTSADRSSSPRRL